MIWARSQKLRLSFGAACAAIVGCGENPAIAPSVAKTLTPPAAVAAVIPAAAAPNPVPVVTPASVPPAADDPSLSTVTPTLAETPEPNATAAYEAPFPERLDLFVPPKRQGSALQEIGSEDAIVLLGFIRLERPQAVLSINGQITRIAEGDSQHGIEVISIQSPKVVLQRGRQRWQASLEN